MAVEVVIVIACIKNACEWAFYASLSGRWGGEKEQKNPKQNWQLPLPSNR